MSSIKIILKVLAIDFSWGMMDGWVIRAPMSLPVAVMQQPEWGREKFPEKPHVNDWIGSKAVIGPNSSLDGCLPDGGPSVFIDNVLHLHIAFSAF